MSAAANHEARAVYSALLDGELGAEQQAAWQARVSEDAELAADYAGFVSAVGALRGLRPAPLTETRVARLMAAVEGAGGTARATPRGVALPFLGALLTAAALWWLLVLDGTGALGALLPARPAPRAPAEFARHDAPSAPAASAPASRLATLEPAAPADAWLAADHGAASDAPPGDAVPPTPADDALLAQPARAADPRPDASPALRADARRPRPRGAAGLNLVRGDERLALGLRGEPAALVPRLIELLDADDPELVMLAHGRLVLLKDDLVARGELPPGLARDPLAELERGAGLRAAGGAPRGEAAAAWAGWWTRARAHLPAALDRDVL